MTANYQAHCPLRSRLVIALVLLQSCCSFEALPLQAAEPSYNSDPSSWLQVVVPPRGPNPEHTVWFYTSNYSPISWSVAPDHDGVRAVLDSSRPKQLPPPTPFVPETETAKGATAALQVIDGWLVAFNHGEFGGTLWWFSPDGTLHYRLSNDRVQTFFRSGEQILAIEGLEHMGGSEGSLVRLARDPESKRWKAVHIAELTSTPYAVSQHSTGDLLITLSESLIAIAPRENSRARTLVHCRDWGGLYPTSSVLTKDERTVYIGMRQFVCRVNIGAKSVEFLVPDATFLHKLPAEDEARMRQTYRNGAQDN